MCEWKSWKAEGFLSHSRERLEFGLQKGRIGGWGIFCECPSLVWDWETQSWWFGVEPLQIKVK